MFKAKTSYSTNVDPFEAGKEAAEKAVKGGNIKVGLVFTNCDMDQTKVLEGIRSVYKNKPLIGCTTSGGLITNEGLITGDSYVGLFTIKDDDMIVGIASCEANGDAREAGKILAREAISNAGIKKVPSYFYIVATPKEEESYLKGIEDVIGSVPFFGGSAADNNASGAWSILAGDKVIKDGCAVAFFYAKNEIKTEFTGDYDETENVGVITKTEGNRKLVSIDGVQASKKYAKWINKKPADINGGKVFTESILNPIGIKDPLGNITAVRQVMKCEEDGSLIMSNDIAKGTAVIKLTTSENKLLESVPNALVKLNEKMKSTPESYFLIHSGIRTIGLNGRTEQLYNKIKEITNDKEFMMVFSFGEYGRSEHSASTCMALSLSFVSFGE